MSSHRTTEIQFLTFPARICINFRRVRICLIYSLDGVALKCHSALKWWAIISGNWTGHNNFLLLAFGGLFRAGSLITAWLMELQRYSIFYAFAAETAISWLKSLLWLLQQRSEKHVAQHLTCQHESSQQTKKASSRRLAAINYEMKRTRRSFLISFLLQLLCCLMEWSDANKLIVFRPAWWSEDVVLLSERQSASFFIENFCSQFY